MSTTGPRVQILNTSSMMWGVSNYSNGSVSSGNYFLRDAGDSTTRTWTIVSAPYGATITETIVGKQLQIADASNPDGCYLVQCDTDGGGPGETVQIVVGASLECSAIRWLTSSPEVIASGGAIQVRIPALGETTTFNTQPGDPTSLNARGWARELEAFLRTVQNYGFGVKYFDGVNATVTPSIKIKFLGTTTSVNIATGEATIQAAMALLSENYTFVVPPALGTLAPWTFNLCAAGTTIYLPDAATNAGTKIILGKTGGGNLIVSRSGADRIHSGTGTYTTRTFTGFGLNGFIADPAGFWVMHTAQAML